MSQNLSNYRRIKNCFIANRGEIAKRVILSLSKMGIGSCVVGSSEDKDFLSTATCFNLIENLDASFYLDPKRIIDQAIQFGADSIHPGYGFLSEDPETAKLVSEAGLSWIGPTYKSMKLLGDKISSKKLARTLGIPCLKSCTVESALDKDFDIKKVEEKTAGFCYPLIIKGGASGGGKGMRVLKDPKDLLETIQKVASDCLRYFGSSSLIIEEYKEKVRHIELQLVCDKYQNIFNLGTRDCSIQRRYQKLIEEAPARLDSKLEQDLYGYSKALMREAGYDSIGTVEFLVDERGNPYFLEVNTRIQVEHPVTEMICGLDLVELQIEISSGINLVESSYYKKLRAIDSKEFNCTDHSIELRLCAEDPQTLFPVSGKVFISSLVAKDDKDIRWDRGILFDQDQFISSGFDSLLAKCIVRGESRDDCIKKLQKILNYTFITGTSNLSFLKKILSEPDFISAKIYTDYIESHMDKLVFSNKKDTGFLPCFNPKYNLNVKDILTWAFCDIKTRWNFDSSFKSKDLDGYSYEMGSCNSSTESISSSGSFDYSGYSSSSTSRKEIQSSSLESEVKSKYEIYPKIPAKVISSTKKVGESIKKDDLIFLLESMKMQIEVRSETSGTIGYLTDKSWVTPKDLLVKINPLDNTTTGS